MSTWTRDFWRPAIMWPKIFRSTLSSIPLWTTPMQLRCSSVSMERATGSIGKLSTLIQFLRKMRSWWNNEKTAAGLSDATAFSHPAADTCGSDDSVRRYCGKMQRAGDGNRHLPAASEGKHAAYAGRLPDRKQRICTACRSVTRNSY